MLIQFQGGEVLLLMEEILFSQGISTFLLVETNLIQMSSNTDKPNMVLF